MPKSSGIFQFERRFFSVRDRVAARKIGKIAGAVVATLTIVACSSTTKPPERTADAIYIGENIVTMDANTDGASAVAVIGDEILAVGPAREIQKLRSGKTRVVELGDKALLPGFIDAHGHVMFSAMLAESANLASPPVGSIETIDDLIVALSIHADKNPVPEGGWLTGFGYDDSLLKENRHPTRFDLDKVSTSVPIYIMHVSGHLAVVNSAALEQIQIDADTPNPDGGVIRRTTDGRTPNGVLEEKAVYPVAFRAITPRDASGFNQRIRSAIEEAARYGVTTVQEGGLDPKQVAALRGVAAAAPFEIDLAAFVRVQDIEFESFEQIGVEQTYENGFRVAGYKFVLDGSPQGRTAWMREPYTEGPEGAAADYVAYPQNDVDDYNRRLQSALDRGVPSLVHANGDAAIDAMLDGLEKAGATLYEKDHRSVIIHAQLMRQDQIQRALKLGAVPSYFSAHSYFWGDWHRKSFGDERALGISPTNSSLKAGLKFTVHNDSPVVPPDVMRLVWATVNRQTRSGFTLGADERITTEQALRAVTIDAAYQYFEEQRKGSISPGKQADFVILEENPLTADPATLANIAIVETIARGVSVYRRAD